MLLGSSWRALALLSFVVSSAALSTDLCLGTASSKNRINYIASRARLYDKFSTEFYVITDKEYFVRNAKCLHPFDDDPKLNEPWCVRYALGPHLIYNATGGAYDWYFFSDDDAVVNPKNLRALIKKSGVDPKVPLLISDDVGGRCHKNISYETAPRCTVGKPASDECPPPMVGPSGCSFERVLNYSRSDCWKNLDGVTMAFNMPWGAFGWVISRAAIEAVPYQTAYQNAVDACSAGTRCDAALTDVFRSKDIGASSFASVHGECAFGKEGRGWASKNFFFRYPRGINNIVSEEIHLPATGLIARLTSEAIV